MINGYGCYTKYIAIKSHFCTEKYDYFKYKGAIRADITSFQGRRDKYFFEKLAKVLRTEQAVEDFFVSNFVTRSNLWVGEALEEQSTDNYLTWKKKIESLSYLYKKDLTKVIDKIEESNKQIQEAFRCGNGQHPPLLKMFLRKEIMLESLIILNSFLGFFDDWNENITENIVWSELYKKCVKYEPFLYSMIPQAKFRQYKNITKNILIDKINS